VKPRWLHLSVVSLRLSNRPPQVLFPRVHSGWPRLSLHSASAIGQPGLPVPVADCCPSVIHGSPYSQEQEQVFSQLAWATLVRVTLLFGS
jgi:hypothetical protein